MNPSTLLLLTVVCTFCWHGGAATLEEAQEASKQTTKQLEELQASIEDMVNRDQNNDNSPTNTEDAEMLAAAEKLVEALEQNVHDSGDTIQEMIDEHYPGSTMEEVLELNKDMEEPWTTEDMARVKRVRDILAAQTEGSEGTWEDFDKLANKNPDDEGDSEDAEEEDGGIPTVEFQGYESYGLSDLDSQIVEQQEFIDEIFADVEEELRPSEKMMRILKHGVSHIPSQKEFDEMERKQRASRKHFPRESDESVDDLDEGVDYDELQEEEEEEGEDADDDLKKKIAALEKKLAKKDAEIATLKKEQKKKKPVPSWVSGSKKSETNENEEKKDEPKKEKKDKKKKKKSKKARKKAKLQKQKEQKEREEKIKEQLRSGDGEGYLDFGDDVEQLDLATVRRLVRDSFGEGEEQYESEDEIEDEEPREDL